MRALEQKHPSALELARQGSRAAGAGAAAGALFGAFVGAVSGALAGAFAWSLVTAGREAFRHYRERHDDED